MGDLSKHFSKSEFACKCGCGFDDIDPVIVARLEGIRAHFNKPVVIHCGCRCAGHNAATKNAAKKSWHMRGKAVDFHVDGVSIAELHRYVVSLGIGGVEALVATPTWVHWDMRTPAKVFMP